ncbi:Lrp/AsnC family transcriptional regulator [Pseudomonas sp. YQ_6]|uniref:Lrp/AsnC family transcriptional regulator n=1 Tax=Pseudomonas TaxID=286 RepID=UPI00255F5D1E|nr:Lrp/AsnC family transcriptional regulator [Pseudomonas sp.]EKT4493077.1 Lrp/AsnC family transcriptional regulator [Pseudomonas putida]EKT8864127.1 Lrp/AsnC family transcriptional regulator [Pseudomonas putida]
MTVEASQIDAFDRHLLELVQRDNQMPMRELAERVNLSLPAVARRLQRLRKSGVIMGDRSVLSPDHVGINTTVIVNVSVLSEVIEDLDAIRQRFLECPQVQQCYYVTGDIDFILIIAVKDMKEYEKLTRELFFEGGNVKRFMTFVAMDRVKVSLDLKL